MHRTAPLQLFNKFLGRNLEEKPTKNLPKPTKQNEKHRSAPAQVQTNVAGVKNAFDFWPDTAKGK